MFVLKQLVRDQITFHNNRYGSAPEIVEILEDEFLDRARQINIDNVSTLYESDMFQKNRFVHDKKRKLIIQTL